MGEDEQEVLRPAGTGLRQEAELQIGIYLFFVWLKVKL